MDNTCIMHLISPQDHRAYPVLATSRPLTLHLDLWDGEVEAIIAHSSDFSGGQSVTCMLVSMANGVTLLDTKRDPFNNGPYRALRPEERTKYWDTMPEWVASVARAVADFITPNHKEYNALIADTIHDWLQEGY